MKFVEKETPNLDAVNAIGIADDDNYTIYDNLADKILGIRPRDSYKFGISRSNLIYLQRKIRENGVLRLQKNTLGKLKRDFSDHGRIIKFYKSMISAAQITIKKAKPILTLIKN